MCGVQSFQQLLLARVRGRAGEVMDGARRALVGVLKQPDHALSLCKLNARKPVFDVEIAVVGKSFDTGVLEDALDLCIRCLCPALDFLLYSVQMAACGLINLKLPLVRKTPSPRPNRAITRRIRSLVIHTFSSSICGYRVSMMSRIC